MSTFNSSRYAPRYDSGDERLPVVIGSDTEVGNFLTGRRIPAGRTGDLASRLLLEQVEGFGQRSQATHGQCDCTTCRARRENNTGQGHSTGSAGGGLFGSSATGSTYGGSYGGSYGSSYGGGYSTMGYGTGGYGGGHYGASSYNPQDRGRKFLASNGGCIYIDLDHLELCTPEVRSAYDYTAAWHAMLAITRSALDRVNHDRTDDTRVRVLINNSDGMDNSYGGHLSFLIRRALWENIFHRKAHYLACLASFQVSSIVFTGQGKAGSENGAPPVQYQLTQRGDFFETLCAPQTTYRRPIVNSRNEALCGQENRAHFTGPDDGDRARLHVIFYDSSLCHVACVLKTGTMQLLLAMLDAGHLNPALLLDDPLEALTLWGHDLSLSRQARLASGTGCTAIELQQQFLAEAWRFAETGGFEGVVPRWQELLALWQDTLDCLARGDLDALAGRLDWVTRYLLIEQALSRNPALDWNAPQVKVLDHLYCSLDPADGLFHALNQAGEIDQLVSPARIEQFIHEPPTDTRAWARAMLLRQAGAGRVDHVDWDEVRFRVQAERGWPDYPRLELPSPLGGTRQQTAHLFDGTSCLEDILEDAEPFVCEPAEFGPAADEVPVASSAAAANDSAPPPDGGTAS